MVFVIHWHESAMDLRVIPIPIPPPTTLTTRFLWVFPVHQPWALVSCIQPGLVICFTLDSIHVSMLISRGSETLNDRPRVSVRTEIYKPGICLPSAVNLWPCVRSWTIALWAVIASLLEKWRQYCLPLLFPFSLFVVFCFNQSSRGKKFKST